ncbi:uncharacterized MFS-type transporter Rv0849/MT0872 [Arthrobacter sp. Hiyo8]|nr:uncharacterized MFS-type transporter Rv0849/MT0872 [Arthrobacter sp. Hiyo8]
MNSRAEPTPRLLLASQLIFNLGFYSVVPFLAVLMREDFGMGAMAVGIVLGARTFAQQGLFLVGGAAADRWGARPVMIAGCLARISGYLLLLWASDFPLFLLGAVITGAGGASFHPLWKALWVGPKNDVPPFSPQNHSFRAAGHFRGNRRRGRSPARLRPASDRLRRGPARRGGVFAVMAVVFGTFLPATTASAVATSAGNSAAAPPSDAWSCLRQKGFVSFAAFYSVNLFAYNQLYFGLPIELERSDAGLGALSAIFAYASILIITLQWPIARLMKRKGPGVALAAGFAVQALGSSLSQPWPPSPARRIPCATGVPAGHCARRRAHVRGTSCHGSGPRICRRTLHRRLLRLARELRRNHGSPRQFAPCSAL